jgi:predicted transglutaminase-like cysteine proteinase
MRKISTLAALAAAAMFAGYQQAHAGLLGMPIGLQSAIQHIKFETPTLAPMAYTQFWLRYQAECRSRITFRGGPVRLTEAGDLVLDNMTSRIRPWSRTPYRWVRIQQPADTRLWATISKRGA